MDKGLVHVYCGDGKGKTTAAMGLAVRAAGRGMPVVILQFLKGGGSGELEILRNIPGIRVIPGPDTMKFIFRMTDEEKRDYASLCRELFCKACDSCSCGGLLILDEVLDAVDTGMLPESALLDFLSNRPQPLEVVMTGRAPSERVSEAADYITEMRKLKHPYDSGAVARRGIEF